MSKNHPHDNIYSILGKLEALKPTPEEKRFALVKEIRESVEAQGSILSGVDAVQAKLARQFAESQVAEKSVSTAQQKFMGMVHAAQKGEKAASPEVAKVAKSMGKKDAKDFAGTKHKGLPQHVNEKYNAVKAVKQCAKDYMEMNGIASVHDLEAEDIESIGGDCQMNYQDVCEILGCNLPNSLGPVKSWDTDAQGNKFDLEETTCNECGMYESKCSCNHTNEGAGDLGQQINDLFGQIYDHGSGDDSLEYLDRNAPLWTELFDKHGGDIDAIIANEPDEVLAQAVEELEGVLSDLPYELDEGEITRKHGVTTHTKTDYPGYPVDDNDDIDDENKGKRGRPRKHAKKEPTGLGRGRPKKDKPLGHNAPKMHDPFSRVGHSAEKKATVKGRVHSMDESMSRLERRLVEGLNFKQMAEETDLTIDELMSELQQDILSYKKTGHCSDKLGDFLKVHAHGKKQREMEEAAELEANVTPIRPGIPRNNAPQPTVPPGSGPTLVPPAGGIHGNFLDPMSPKDQHTKLNPPRTLEEINPIEEELAKLAELAGITMGEGVDKTKFAALAEPKDEITYADKIAGAKLHDKTDEEVETEGNRFGKEVSDAKADGIQPGEKITVGGKEYPVKEETTFDECGDTNSDLANALLQMLRIAGLGGGAKAHELEQEPVVIDIIGNPDEVVDEADAPYDEGNEELANAPDEEYQTMRQSTMNPGEADNGEKAMHPDRPTFKNGDNALAKPANEAVIKLEAKLAAEYESIKKVSK